MRQVTSTGDLDWQPFYVCSTALLMIASVAESRLLEVLGQVCPEIKSVQIDYTEYGLCARVKVASRQVPFSVLERVGKIARAAESLAPLHSLQINELEPYLLSEIRRVCAEEWVASDKPSENLKALCRLLMQEASRDRSLVDISPSGVYLAFHPRTGSNPPVSPEQMIGRTVREVAGARAHDSIVAAIARAISTGQAIDCTYKAKFESDEDYRHYAARVMPKPDGSGAYLAVARIDLPFGN